MTCFLGGYIRIRPVSGHIYCVLHVDSCRHHVFTYIKASTRLCDVRFIKYTRLNAVDNKLTRLHANARTHSQYVFNF